MVHKIAIVAGVRTPFLPTEGRFANLSAIELGRLVVSEAIARGGIDPARLGAVIFGSVAPGPATVNLARAIALSAGIPEQVPAFTVQRDDASGLQAIISGSQAIATGEADLVLVGGVESMANHPAPLFAEVHPFAHRFRQCGARLSGLLKWHPGSFIPQSTRPPHYPEPSCGRNQDEMAELLARELAISREAQDEYALDSHRRAAAAQAAERFKEEIMTVLLPPEYQEAIDRDPGVNGEQNRDFLAALPPLFAPDFGTVTAGNSAANAEGAVALLLAGEKALSRYGLTALGYVREHAFAGLAQHLGLGPAHATARLLERTGRQLTEFGLFEMHETAAAQIIANELVCADENLSRRYLNRPALGEINRNLLNVNGGALAMGHPRGASGTRLVLTLLLEMRRRKVDLGLASLGSSGGQGTALIIERGRA
ncbi:MAG: thiolase family protein [Desulfobulbaceae bacterium]|nr:thiolase family protein [Desulfobulbaceae bacterium]